MSNAPIGILVTRGSWGNEMIHEVHSILKIESELLSISYEPESIQLERPKFTGKIVWFVDAPGTTAERAIQSVAIAGDVIITGFSLPLLLSFTTKRNQLTFENLLNSCMDAHRRGCCLRRF